MRAMILAAGRGERMRPLSDTIPKPLLPVAGKPLVVHHLERLAAAGYREIVVNLAHLGHLIRDFLGDGSRYGVHVEYSVEGLTAKEALETAGGIVKALPLLGDGPFLVVNGDIWCDHPLDPPAMRDGDLAHLVLVDNPPHHPEGDFVLDGNRTRTAGSSRLTFAGIGWYRPELFTGLEPGRRPLAPVLLAAAANDRVSGEHWHGVWADVGTPETLNRMQVIYSKNIGTNPTVLYKRSS